MIFQEKLLNFMTLGWLYSPSMSDLSCMNDAPGTGNILYESSFLYEHLLPARATSVATSSVNGHRQVAGFAHRIHSVDCSHAPVLAGLKFCSSLKWSLQNMA